MPVLESGSPEAEAAAPPPDGGAMFGDASMREGGPLGCEADSHRAEPQPLGIYVMVDQSASMSTAWSPIAEALNAFVDDSGQLQKTSVGIQYFIANPTTGFPANAPTLCEVETYIYPDVPIAPLPDNAQALAVSLNTHGPANLLQKWLENLTVDLFITLGAMLSDSPTDAALTGAIEGARRWHANHASENPRAVVLLVTDAVPGTAASPECNATLAGTTQAAADGFNGTPSIATYVLGVGDRLDDLSTIALAGGTVSAHVVQTGSAPQDILAELAALRSVAVPCDFAVEERWSSAGRINIELAVKGETAPLSRVAGSGACPAAPALAWYPEGSDRVVLCPSTCENARSSPDAVVNVVYGCPTTQ
jgi:hypothetical protein